MTPALREFNERMSVQTRRGTHTEFMESLSPAEARQYLDAFDCWLVGENPQATGDDYYWRSLLMEYFFPDPKQRKADLKRAVALDPGNVDIWVSLGHMAAEQKQWSEAIAYYDAGIKARPGNFFPWYGRALALAALRRFEESLRDINRAIDIHPRLAYGYEARGRIYEDLGELEKAVADLDFAVQCSAATPGTQRYRDQLRKKLHRQT
jgi:tetratricopeptide (TPR) repeat protein